MHESAYKIKKCYSQQRTNLNEIITNQYNWRDMPVKNIRAWVST